MATSSVISGNYGEIAGSGDNMDLVIGYVINPMSIFFTLSFIYSYPNNFYSEN